MAGAQARTHASGMTDATHVHWKNGLRVACGTPDGADASADVRAVTCPQCVAAFEIEAVHRVAVHRLSVAIARVRAGVPLKT